MKVVVLQQAIAVERGQDLVWNVSVETFFLDFCRWISLTDNDGSLMPSREGGFYKLDIIEKYFSPFHLAVYILSWS
jgi:hypothetical protein